MDPRDFDAVAKALGATTSARRAPSSSWSVLLSALVRPRHAGGDHRAQAQATRRERRRARHRHAGAAAPRRRPPSEAQATRRERRRARHRHAGGGQHPGGDHRAQAQAARRERRRARHRHAGGASTQEATTEHKHKRRGGSGDEHATVTPEAAGTQEATTERKRKRRRTPTPTAAPTATPTPTRTRSRPPRRRARRSRLPRRPRRAPPDRHARDRRRPRPARSYDIHLPNAGRQLVDGRLPAPAVRGRTRHRRPNPGHAEGYRGKRLRRVGLLFDLQLERPPRRHRGRLVGAAAQPGSDACRRLARRVGGATVARRLDQGTRRRRCRHPVPDVPQALLAGRVNLGAVYTRRTSRART